MSQISSEQVSLVLDASAKDIHIGLIQADRWIEFKRTNTPALQSLFLETQTFLKKNNINLNEIGSIFFCEGPGSILGIRIAAMAISTWAAIGKLNKNVKLYSYQSLPVCAALLCQEKDTPKDFEIITEYRLNRWHHLQVKSNTPSALEILDSIEQLKENLPCYHLRQRMTRMLAPSNAQAIEYNLEKLPTLTLIHPQLFKTVDTPTVYTPEAPKFAKWTPQRHRGK